MSMKEFLWTTASVAVGIIIGTIILSKLPTSIGGGGMWEES